ncbi:MAG TPA: hypothetical protein PLB32_22835 [Acidobacteriota bacterium]|nr:hypothetical protein [Acidobacteriota bacterium]
MNCPDAREYLSLIELDGDRASASLPTRVIAEAQVHLRACPECQSWQVKNQRLEAALRQIPPEPPPSTLTIDVMDQIRLLAEKTPVREAVPQLQRPKTFGKWWFKPGFLAQGLAAAATILFVFTPAGIVFLTGLNQLIQGSGPSQVAGNQPSLSDGIGETFANIAGQLHFSDSLIILAIVAVAVLGNSLLIALKKRKSN